MASAIVSSFSSRSSTSLVTLRQKRIASWGWLWPAQ